MKNMKNNFRYFETEDQFYSLKRSADYLDMSYIQGRDGSITMGTPDILYGDICFLQDTHLAWTHGAVFFDYTQADERILSIQGKLVELRESIERANPEITIIMNNVYEDVSNVTLNCTKNLGVKGDLVWSCNLSSDIAEVNDTVLVFKQHYEGPVTVTVTAANASASHTFEVECGDLGTVSYSVKDVVVPDSIAADATSFDVTMTGVTTTHYEHGKPDAVVEQYLTHTVEITPNTKYTKRTSTGSFEWNGVTVEWTVEQEPAAQPNNVIVYTSSDDNVVTPRSSFDGAKILSNEYSDGLGIITFDRDLMTIGEYAFYQRSNLTEITIPNSVTTIGIYAFQDCSKLTSVNIPDSVTTIGTSAFYGCSSLTSIEIPDSVTTIGNSAFLNVPHIEYHGTATGSPWGALSIN